MNNRLHPSGRRQRTVGLLTIAAAMAAPSCGGSSSSDRAERARATREAVTANRSAFVWSSNPTSSYTANSEFQSPSNIPITHLSTGHYLVAFPHLGADASGHVQVTNYGWGNQRCKVEDWWSTGTTLDVSVACYAPSGASADSEFTASFVARSDTPGQEGGYLWAFAPVNPASYDAASIRSWNSTGGPITIQRLGTGTYQVTFAGQGFPGGTVEVSAFGMDSNYCEASGWWPSGNDQLVFVSCFSSIGTPADSMYDLSFTQGSPNGTSSYTYAWADQPSTTTDYTTDPEYQKGVVALTCGSNPTPAPVDITHTATGFYTVNFPGMPFSTSSTDPFRKTNVKVTAYGWNGEYCSVAGWGGSASNAFAFVTCFDASGNSVDSFFDVTYSATYYVVC